MILRFQKNPVVIEAFQLTDSIFENRPEVGVFSTTDIVYDPVSRTAAIKTLEGTMTAKLGDWIIKGISGEYYPCKPDIFVRTYTEVK